MGRILTLAVSYTLFLTSYPVSIVIYLGSKAKLSSHLLPILNNLRDEGQLYVEPFMGGCNMLDKVTGRRWGNDKHYYLVKLFEALNRGWEPPSNVSRAFYNEVKRNKDNYPPELVAFIGFGCTFGSMWWAVYACCKKDVNYALRCKKGLMAQKEGLKGVRFTNLDYTSMVFEERSLIYCDPPYKGTAGYSVEFDYDGFWGWAWQKHWEGHTVVVSEYSAPKGVKEIASFKVKCVIDKGKGSFREEKVFMFE